MKGLVTIVGGAGFIGERLAGRLLRDDWLVRVVDMHPSRLYPHLSLVADIRVFDELVAALRGSDSVINLAAIHHDNERPVQRYYDTNSGGMATLCKALDALQINTLVFASSVAVYRPSNEVVNEETACAPMNHYGKSKLRAEEICRRWQSESVERSLIIIRPSVVFGEGNRGNIYRLWRQIESGRFAMVGRGDNRKSMAYVENAAGALQWALDLPAGAHIFNYADRPDLRMDELSTIFWKASPNGGRALPRIPYWIGLVVGICCDLASAIIRRPLPISAVRIRKFCSESRVDASKIADAGYQAPVEMRAALDQTIANRFE